MTPRLPALAAAALLAAGCAVSPDAPPRMALEQGEPHAAKPVAHARTGHRAAIETADANEGARRRDWPVTAATLPVAPQPGAPDAPLEDPLTCLARTVYFESRGRGDREQTAVAWVVLNRAEAEGYPDDVCAVVKQGGSARPCQFSWFCDGRPDEAGHAREYAQSLNVAQKVLSGEVEDPTGGATMFHNRTVRPSWTRRARLMAEIGAHFFWKL
ncbi:cell wall hydrolase [Albimonas pacifica]|uniref:Cell wall hydrolase CwlJ, involved in spore germination n=1 Tax=Albimonas pacifica TaxID=1114924 RepID=A0A1I3PQ32_9RHOB|nr:cell wall hydrolase [Albimonas pacifica]SFJ23602.1 Cell wall hydrolase CwlJ, involved in spore germination [Albimonas pacifica]